MTTTISEAQINAFLDGQLDEREEAEVLAFLEQNPSALHDLRKKADHKHQLAAAIDDIADENVDPATEALAMRLIDRVKRQQRLRRAKTWSALGLAALVLAAVGWFGHDSFVTTQRLPPLLADAARDHQLFARSIKPVEFSASDRDDMARVFSSHLGETVEIPNLEENGYRLVGGRLLGAEEGPFVQLLYDDGQDHLLSVYLAKQDSRRAEDLQIAEVSGLGAGYWGTEHLSYAVVAEAPLEQVREIATTLAAAR